MLTLPIKKKWFNMELAGIKRDEYREIKPYWTSRLAKLFGYINCATFTADTERFLNDLKAGKDMGTALVEFKNGYGRNAPSFVCRISVSIGTGKEEWGAVPGKEYYRFHIKSIVGIDKN